MPPAIERTPILTAGVSLCAFVVSLDASLREQQDV